MAAVEYCTSKIFKILWERQMHIWWGDTGKYYRTCMWCKWSSWGCNYM